MESKYAYKISHKSIMIIINIFRFSYKNMQGFINFTFINITHNSNINLQVECDPLRKCARPRSVVCTGGAAKTRKWK